MKKYLILFLYAFQLLAQNSLQVAGGTYTSTADTLAITGLGIGTPKFVMIKLNTTTYPIWKCASHTADSSAIGSGADIDDGIISLDNDGFTLGLDGSVQTGTTAGAYIAISGTGITTGTYTGTGSSANVTTGFQPGMIILHRHDAGESFFKLSLESSSNAIGFLQAEAANILTIISTGFQSGSVVSTANKKFTWIAIEDNANFFADSSYTGNGGASRDFATAITARLVFAKRTNNTNDVAWKTHATAGTVTYRLGNFANDAVGSFNAITTNNINIGADALVNTNTAPYYLWYLGSYTPPVPATTTTGKFKGNTTYNKFKGF